MATYRLIHQEAETGARSSSLSDFGFCVWISYQLAADDFGVCPATAAKLQGASPRLSRKAPKVVQAEIETIITVGLCRVFTDGPQRYLYQPDWQDRQRLKHATATALPPVPVELLEQCSPKTRALFAEFHPKIREGFSAHAGACDAPANADASASGSFSEKSPRETIAPSQPPRVPRGRPGLVAGGGRWGMEHAQCVDGFCTFVCLRRTVFTEFVTRAMSAGFSEAEAQHNTLAWAQGVRAQWAARREIPGANIFDFWRNEWAGAHTANKPSSSPALADPLAGLREAERRG